MIWASTYDSRLCTRKLVVFQKRAAAARITAGVFSYSHISPLFEEFKLLKFFKIRIFHVI